MKSERTLHRILLLTFPLWLVGCGEALETAEPSASLEQQSMSMECQPQLAAKIVGYGQMGRRGCGYFDRCEDGLVPHNVDSREGYNYAPAEDGWFSCWGNSPDVICYSQPQLHDYINVRICYTRPDGSQVDYGCGC